jgi:hypothetical protein
MHGDMPANEDLHIDDCAMLQLFDELRQSYDLLPFPAQKEASYRYYYENSAYSYGDAAVLFTMLLRFRPRRLIEAGSGYSSCVVMDTNDRFLDGAMDTAFIDPYPETLYSLLDENDPYRANIRTSTLQDTDIDCFKALSSGDILFIDSSHVLKTGSDVCDYLFRIFPALQPGVIIHIHDIIYPFDYKREWLADENRSWNEAYALRAFLQYNSRFRIIYFNHYMFRKHSDLLRQHMPMCLRNCGASIWLEKQ